MHHRKRYLQGFNRDPRSSLSGGQRTREADGAKVGDTLEFWFNGFCRRFNVNELKPGKRVAGKSSKGQGNNEWEETEITFDLSTIEKQTFILFRHSCWRETND